MARGGYVKVTASAVVNSSGKPQRVYSISIDSGSTGGIVTLRNGTGSGSDAIASPQGVANQQGFTPNWPAEGSYFPAGLYVSIDANVTAAHIFVEQMASS